VASISFPHYGQPDLLAATAPSKICLIPEPVFGVEGVGMDVIPKLEPRIMRYELSDYEWAAIKPLLPNEPRGVPLVDDRRVLNVIFGHCDQARHGAIYLTALVPTRPG
jgi:hypothetical protein